MYLSRLILNPRSRLARRDIADCHDLHRTILSAFPQKENDSDGARCQFAVLHRLDIDRRTGRVTLLVQSNERPDWSRLPKDYLAETDAENPACKPIEEIYNSLRPGARLAFRLRANPTRKIDTRTGPDGKRRNGRRVDLRSEEDRLAWLRRKAEASGFRLLAVRLNDEVANLRVQPEGKYTGRREATGKLSFGSVLFEGELEITDSTSFLQALSSGIGSGKAYGFGLLSIAPVRG
ncbi:MAG: type I-E CRISPR-associated protein Cas6/Cse3/CasE [Acidobacteriota bacterium]